MKKRLHISNGLKGSIRIVDTEMTDTLSGGWKLRRTTLSSEFQAAVSEGGTIDRKNTLTRVATAGIAAPLIKKKIDSRYLAVVITGPNYYATLELDANEKHGVRDAQRFVAAFNAHAASITAEASA